MIINIGASTKAIKITQVDDAIFDECFCAHCLNLDFCHDACCEYGCDVDGAEADRILSYRSELSRLLETPHTGWFHERVKDADYPSGEYARARVYQGKCVFYANGRGGCTLHRFALENGIDVYQLKPMVCFLFPLSWGNGVLSISDLFNELPCKDEGLSVFEIQKQQLEVYLGQEFVSELEKIVSKRFKKIR